MAVLDSTGQLAPPPAAEAPPARPWTCRRVVQVVVLVVPVVAFAGAAWAHRWVTDDGFIYYRVVEQVVDGHGPLLNEGERVEAYTSVLWVVVLALADLVTPVRLEWLGVVLGVAFTLAGVGFAMAGSMVWQRRVSAGVFVVPFGVAAFMALVPAWVFATSGLETGLTFGWLGVCTFLLARWSDGGGDGALPLWQAAVLGLGWLIRPELVLLSGAFLVIVVGSQWRRASPQVVVRTVAAMVALPLLYQIFRMGYFGEPVTNTAIAKEGTDVELERGWGYLRNFADPYWLWVPVLVLVVGGYVPTVAGLWQEGHRRAVAVVVAVGGFAVVNAGYVTVVGGDYIHSRLLLPAFFAFCCPVAVVGVTRRNAAGLALVPWLLAAVLVLRPPQWEIDQHFTDDLVFFPTHRWMGRVTAEDARPDPAGWYQGDGFYLQQGFGMYERVDVDIRPGLPESIGAFSGVGLVSYTAPTDFYVLDTLGLANALVSHFESMPSTTIGQRLPGHEKPLPAPWVAALVTPEGAEVDPGDLTKSPDPLIPSTEGKAFDLQVAWARAALECDEIARLRDSAEAPMSPGRFLTNLVDSFSNWRLRIPPDPEQAYRKFCGKGVPPEVERVRAER